MNIGDFGHPPGALPLLGKHFSEAEIMLCPGKLGHGSRELLTKGYPKLKIVEGCLTRLASRRRPRWPNCGRRPHSLQFAVTLARAERWSHQENDPFRKGRSREQPWSGRTIAEAVRANVSLCEVWRSDIEIALSLFEIGRAPCPTLITSARSTDNWWSDEHGVRRGGRLTTEPSLAIHLAAPKPTSQGHYPGRF